MLSRAFRIFTIRGIDVRLDPTLLVLAVLLVWAFAMRFAVEYGAGAALGMATLGMVLLFASILAHELAHALEARHRGIEVEGITLLIFGGVTQMHSHSTRPRDEFAVAAVGPFVSLLCGAIFGLLGMAAANSPVGAELAHLLRLLALLNVLLAAFNLVPGAPLDGGRVLRAGLWAMTGDRARAIRIAARAGQGLGAALALYGVSVMLRSPAYLAALWLVAIGSFLFWAAGAEHRNSRLDSLYTDTTVREVVAVGREHPETSFPLAPPGAEPATAEADPTAGADPATGADPAEPLPQIDLDADLHELVAAFQGDHGRVLLTDRGRPLGVVEERYVARAVALLRRGARPSPAAIAAAADVGPEVQA